MSRALSSPSASTAVVWYRSTDLRTIDHAPLLSAHTNHAKVLHIFCAGDEFETSVDAGFAFGTRMSRPTELNVPKIGKHRRRFLSECISNLDMNLREKGSKLYTKKGNPETILPRVIQNIRETSDGDVRNAVHVYFHEGESVEETNRQTKVIKALQECACVVHPYFGNTLIHRDDLPFDLLRSLPSTFSAFRRQVESKRKEGGAGKRTVHMRKASTIAGISERGPASLVRKALPEPKMKPQPAFAAEDFEDAVSPFLVPSHDMGDTIFRGGQDEALKRIQHYSFGTDAIATYKKTRNGMIGSDYSSKLSPWLAHGCITAVQIYEAVERYERERVGNESTYWLVFELLWRDYLRFYALRWGSHIFHLYGPKKVVQGRTDKSKSWGRSKQLFDKWALGKTGVPIVDASMRELLATGFQSNRGRQIVASFLTRDMGLDWRMGAMWFESMLLDHDVCSNYGNWTYAAGVGSDPREDRYFHPIKQAKTYDSDCKFIRHWLPEIPSDVPPRALWDPWSHDIASLASTACSYPPPVVKMMARSTGWKNDGSSKRGKSKKRPARKERRARPASGRVQHF